MPTDDHDSQPIQTTEQEFEELIAAALRVDPAGLSGKHKKGSKDREGRAEET